MKYFILIMLMFLLLGLPEILACRSCGVYDNDFSFQCSNLSVTWCCARRTDSTPKQCDCNLNLPDGDCATNAPEFNDLAMPLTLAGIGLIAFVIRKRMSK